MYCSSPWAALALLGVALLALPPTPAPAAAIRTEHDADLDTDHDHPHEHEDEDEDEEDDDGDLDLDLGPGRPLRRVRVPRVKDAGWDLEKMLRSEDPLNWDHGLHDANYEDILSKYSSDPPDELDDWD